MTRPLSPARRRLLLQMENIIANECYNASIENYEPGGVSEAPGRSIRYPLTLRAQDGLKLKVRGPFIPGSASDDMVRSGYYAFGANQLDVMNGLEKILQLLEREHGLRFPRSANMIANGRMWNVDSLGSSDTGVVSPADSGQRGVRR